MLVVMREIFDALLGLLRCNRKSAGFTRQLNVSERQEEAFFSKKKHICHTCSQRQGASCRKRLPYRAALAPAALSATAKIFKSHPQTNDTALIFEAYPNPS